MERLSNITLLNEYMRDSWRVRDMLFRKPAETVDTIVDEYVSWFPDTFPNTFSWMLNAFVRLSNASYAKGNSDLLDRLIQYTHASGVKIVVQEKVPDILAAFISYDHDNLGCFFRDENLIFVHTLCDGKPRSKDAMAATLLHEIAHAFGPSVVLQQYVVLEEVIAESVASICGFMLGMNDTLHPGWSTQYLYAYVASLRTLIEMLTQAKPEIQYRVNCIMSDVLGSYN